MSPRRAEVVSVEKLSKSIDKAVAIALKRHMVHPEKATLAVNWQIIGRVVRELDDINLAFAAARDITRNVELAGIKATPACCGVDGGILIGFVERAAIPMQLGR